MAKLSDLIKKAKDQMYAVNQQRINLGNTIKNNVSPMGSGLVGQGIDKAYNYIQDPNNKPTIPKINNSQSFKKAPFEKIGRGVANFGIDTVNTVLGRGLADPVIDIGKNASNAVDLFYNRPVDTSTDQFRSGPAKLGARIINKNSNAQQYLADVGQTINPLLAAYAPERLGGSIAKSTLKSKIISGAKEGAALGGLYGVGEGLMQGRDQTLSGQLGQSAVGGLEGVALGGALGAATPLGSEALRLANKTAVKVGHGYATGSYKKPGFVDLVGKTAETAANKVATATEKKIKITPKELKVKLSEPLSPNAGEKGFGSAGNELQLPIEKNGKFNVNRLNITPEAKTQLSNEVNTLDSVFKNVTGKKLTNKEAIKTANETSKVLNKTVDRQATLDWEAGLLKARQQLAEQAQSGVVNKDFIDNFIAIKSIGTDIGRKLQSFSINADPKEATAMEQILEGVIKQNKNADEILKAAQGVDFNDPKQAATFYRQFVKPNASEWLDTLRYNSMLSSPNTHINNVFSNFVQSGIVKPLEKTTTGVVDFLAHGSNSKRTSFVGEGPAYAKAYLSSVRDAAQSFSKVMKGESASTNLDTRNIPLAPGGGFAGGLEKTLSFPMKLLEGMDQYFTTMAKAGEMASLGVKQSKGVKIAAPELIAKDNALKTLFKGDLGNKDEGYLLNAIDVFTNKVQGLRTSDNPIVSTVSKFTVPFLKTPINIFKQGLEYSPAGLATLPGNANKTEQISKAIIGSSVMAGAATLLGSDRLTWGEPTTTKEKNAFKAAGKQAYSVKIGDNWISYLKLGPIAFPIAMVAAIDDAEKTSKIDANTSEKILSTVAKFGEFLADQTYAKSIGDMISNAKGGENGWAKIAGNNIQQLIPYRALLGWIERLTDPYQRMADPTGTAIEKQVQLMFAQIPGLADKVPTRKDSFGNPIENKNRVINAFSPLKVTNTNSYEKSADSPQTALGQLSLYAKGLVKDPKNTATAIFTSENLRKINGDTAVLERKKGLDKVDSGDISTQVDHKIALALGGSNNANNIQILSNADNAAKGVVETKLMKLVASGEITKAEAQKRDLNWRDEVKNIPKSEIASAQAEAAKTQAKTVVPITNYDSQISARDGMFVANIDGTPKKFETKNSAVKALQTQDEKKIKEDFLNTGKPSEIQGDKVLIRNPNGTSVTIKKVSEINQKVQDQQLTNDLEDAKRAKDSTKYQQLKAQQYKNLQDQIDNADPVLDQANVLKWKNSQQDIITEVSKIKSYGGSFTKPKSAKKVAVKKPTISKVTLKTSVQKAPVIKAPKKIKIKKVVTKKIKLKK